MRTEEAVSRPANKVFRRTLVKGSGSRVWEDNPISSIGMARMTPRALSTCPLGVNGPLFSRPVR